MAKADPPPVKIPIGFGVEVIVVIVPPPFSSDATLKILAKETPVERFPWFVMVEVNLTFVDVLTVDSGGSEAIRSLFPHILPVQTLPGSHETFIVIVSSVLTTLGPLFSPSTLLREVS